MTVKARFHVGCSGWAYRDWEGVFYPPGLPPGKRLTYYASVFDVVEVDSTFYQIPARSTIKSWKKKTPEGFSFVPKMFRGITHELPRLTREKRLDGLLERYFSSIDGLGDKLAVILVQFPPSIDEGRAGDVVELLSKLPDHYRFAIEFRNDGWFRHLDDGKSPGDHVDGAGNGDTGAHENDGNACKLPLVAGNSSTSTSRAMDPSACDVVETIKRMPNACVAGSIYPGIAPRVLQTARFFLFRFIGDRALTSFSRLLRDKTDEMARVKDLIEINLPGVEDVFVFFNNHYAGFGPGSAALFRGMLGIETTLPRNRGGRQSNLFEFSI